MNVSLNTRQKTGMTITITSSRFGLLTVAEDKVIHFVQGMPGFERLKRFILIDHDVEGVFKWLHSVEDPDVAFLLTQPELYKHDFAVPLGRKEIERLLIKDVSNMVSMVMVCVSGKVITVNLKAPILFNSANMLAMQCIIDREDYLTNYAINP